MTILEQALVFIGSSVASGITWDLLKTSGTTIIKKFKEKFINDKNFKDENQCNDFLETISSKSSNNSNEIFKEIQIIYEKISGNKTVNFSEEFELWLEENKDEFKKILSNITQVASVSIGSQTNMGSGNIINTGIWNGNIGR